MALLYRRAGVASSDLAAGAGLAAAPLGGSDVEASLPTQSVDSLEQSALQVSHSSTPEHSPSPQVPQSSRQEPESSLVPQIVSPH